jgi:hypothetical protein
MLDAPDNAGFGVGAVRWATLTALAVLGVKSYATFRGAKPLRFAAARVASIEGLAALFTQWGRCVAPGVFGNGGVKLAIVVHVNFSPLPGGLPPPAEALTNNERIGRANQDQWLAIRA